MPNAAKTPAIRLWLAVLVSAGLLAALLSRLDPRRAAESLAAADLRLLAAAFVLSALVLGLRGARLALLVPAPGGIVLGAVAVQTFLLRVTPFRLGELAFPWILRRQAGTDPARSLVALAMVRLLDLLAIAALALAAGLLQIGANIAAAAVALSLVAALAALRFLLGPVMKATGRALDVVGLGRLPRVRALFERLLVAGADAARLPASRLALLSALTLLVLLVQTTLMGLILVSFGVHASPMAVALGTSSAQLAQAIPVGAVGSLGTLEAGWTAGFRLAGVALSDAVLTGVAAQLITLLYSAVLALPAAFLLRTGPATARG